MARQQAVNLPWRKPTWGFKSLLTSHLWRARIIGNPIVLKTIDLTVFGVRVSGPPPITGCRRGRLLYSNRDFNMTELAKATPVL